MESDCILFLGGKIYFLLYVFNQPLLETYSSAYQAFFKYYILQDTQQFAFLNPSLSVQKNTARPEKIPLFYFIKMPQLSLAKCWLYDLWGMEFVCSSCYSVRFHACANQTTENSKSSHNHVFFKKILYNIFIYLNSLFNSYSYTSQTSDFGLWTIIKQLKTITTQ